MRSSFLGRSVAVLLVASLASGCSADDGVSLIDPDRGLAGMWVRYLPPTGLPAAVPRPPDDTLFLFEDGSGMWSREVVGSMGIEPLREVASVRTETKGLSLFLLPLVPPCESCRLESAERMVKLIPSGTWRVHRPDADRLVVDPVSGDASGGRQYFRRHTYPDALQE